MRRLWLRKILKSLKAWHASQFTIFQSAKCQTNNWHKIGLQDNGSTFIRYNTSKLTVGTWKSRLRDSTCNRYTTSSNIVPPLAFQSISGMTNYDVIFLTNQHKGLLSKWNGWNDLEGCVMSRLHNHSANSWGVEASTHTGWAFLCRQNNQNDQRVR